MMNQLKMSVKILLCLVIYHQSTTAQPCDCPIPIELEHALMSADSFILGEIQSSTIEEKKNIVTVEVEAIWKGPILNELEVSYLLTDCRLDFKIGEKYIIDSRLIDGSYQTFNCTYTEKFSEGLLDRYPPPCVSGEEILTTNKVDCEFPYRFIRGDINEDGLADISDVIISLEYMFIANENILNCMDAVDFDDSGSIDLTDPIYLLEHFFFGSQALPQPFPNCGVEDSHDFLSPCLDHSAVCRD